MRRTAADARQGPEMLALLFQAAPFQQQVVFGQPNNIDAS